MQVVKKTREEIETKRFFLFDVLRSCLCSSKERKITKKSSIVTQKKSMNCLRRGEMMTKSERERGESKEDAVQRSETLAAEDRLIK